MAITVAEKWESRPSTEGESPSVDLVFVIEGTDDDLAAKAALDATAPAVYDGLVRQTYSIDRIAEDAWEGTVRYGKRSPRQDGFSKYTFEIGTGSQHITQSIATAHRYAPEGETAPDFKGAIGVTPDGIDGVDVDVPVFRWSETHYFDASIVTEAYKHTLYGIAAAPINAAPFRGKAAGEVRFLGASGGQSGDEEYEIAYHFAASPNLTELVVGNITGISKGGWEYLWVLYEEQEDAAAKRLVKRPAAVYVEQVYRSSDYSLLGIGS